MNMDSVYNLQHKYHQQQSQQQQSQSQPLQQNPSPTSQLQSQSQPLPHQQQYVYQPSILQSQEEQHHKLHLQQHQQIQNLHWQPQPQPQQQPQPQPPPPPQELHLQQAYTGIQYAHKHDHNHDHNHHHHHHLNNHTHNNVHERQLLQEQIPLVYQSVHTIGQDAIPTISVEASLRPVESVQHIDDCANIILPDSDRLEEHDSHQIIQAILKAKEALEKPIEERDDRDIHLIDKLCSLVKGFDIFPKTVRRALAEHAVLAVIDETGKELIVHNEILDSYCVLIYGVCEQLDVTKSQTVRVYHVGDAFGVCEPTTDIIRFEGYMRTLWENCAFLCVKRDDFYAILTDPANFPSKEVVRHRDRYGNVFCVSHLDLIKKSTSSTWSNNLQADGSLRLNLPDGHMIVKATEECLLMALVNGYDKIDTDYVDDFLIVFRVFLSLDQLDKDKGLPPGMTKLCSSLTSWLDYEPYRDKVIKIVLTWLSSYYQDFELNCDFSYLFFRELESKLVHLSMNDQLQLLHLTLSTKSKIRNVTISKSSRNQPLPFVISGGYEKNCGIFVSQVYFVQTDGFFNNLDCYPSTKYGNITQMPNPRARQNSSDFRYSGSVRPGDQILEVNGANFTAIKLSEAQSKLNISTHLSLTVRYNPSAFYEMRALPEGKRKSSSISPFPSSNSQSKFTFSNTQDLSVRMSNEGFPPASPLFSSNNNLGFSSLIKTAQKNDKNLASDSKFKISNLINSSKQIVKHLRDSALQSNQDQLSETSSTSIDNNRARSNPDLCSVRNIGPIQNNNSQFDTISTTDSSAIKDQSTLNVLRIFNAANNEFRYILIHEETTARETVMVAVKEFNLTQNTSSLDWRLYEVSVVPESRTIKQKCLSEQTIRLAERAPLCSRFYIKNNVQASTNGPTRLESGDDTLVTEILKESPQIITLTSLNATLLAVELTLIDFDKFKSIEPQQFVYDTFFDYSEKHNGNGSDTSSLQSSSSDGQDIDPLHILNKTRKIPKDWMVEYQEFADISNKEMFWVICEILNERNIGRRVKIVKQFVRVADVCLQLRNYNSMFAIISGLGHSCVSRLRRTFEKLKPKYKNQLEKMRTLFDPSRNMSNYRLCLSQTPPPAIPLFPQIKKDLTFTKEGRSIFVRESNDMSDDEDESDYLQQLNQRTDVLTSRKSNFVRHDHYSSNGSRDSLLVNFAEIRQFTERVSNVTYFSSVPYSNDLLTNNKESQRNQAQIKKMYEEYQMRKRIRHYLNETLSTISRETDQTDGISKASGKLEITYDERILHSRSLVVESDLNTNTTNRHPLPTGRCNQQEHQLQALQQLQQQRQQQQPTISQFLPALTMQAVSNGSPSLSESSSLQSLPYPRIRQITYRPTNDQKRSMNVAQKVRGCDSFVYDTVPADAHFHAQHQTASSLSLDPEQQQQLPPSQQQQHHQQHSTQRIPFAPPLHSSHMSSYYTTRGKFGTDNSENLRKLQSLSEARHRAKPIG